jgi:hybrid cluster-associated redox disulfide protein
MANARGVGRTPLATTGRVTVFHKDQAIIDALALHPGARAVFERYGMACSLCMGASSESIEAGAVMHCVSPDEVVTTLNELLVEQT